MTDPPYEVVNPQAEKLLEELNLEWSLAEIALDDIDIDKSLANQARIIPVIEERVDRYTVAMKMGAVFPAVLLAKNGRLFIIADGVQRTLAARRADLTTEWAYTFPFETEGFRALADTANARLNGADNTLEERLMHAAYHVGKGVSLKKASVLFGVTTHQIDMHRRASTARRRCQELGIGSRTYASLPDATLVRIAACAADDALRASFSALAGGHRVTDVVEALRNAGSEVISGQEKARRQVEALERLKEDRLTATAGALRKPKPRRVTIAMRLKGALVAIEQAKEASPEYDELLDEIRHALS